MPITTSPPAARTLGRTVAAILTTTALALTLPACSADGDPSAVPEAGTSAPIEVRIGTTPSVSHLNAAVAVEDGFFESNGIDATLDTQQNAGAIVQALGSEYDVILTTATDINFAVGRGLDMVIISSTAVTTSDDMLSAVVASGESGVTDWADLAGKRVATANVSSVLAVAMLAAVKGSGGDVSSVTLIETPFPSMVDQVSSGAVAAAGTVPPFLGQIEQLPGAVNLGIPAEFVAHPTGTEGDWDLSSAYWVTTSDFLAEHPELPEKWRSALGEAAEWVLDEANVDAAYEALAEFTNVPLEVARQNFFPTDYGYSRSVEQMETDLSKWRDAIIAVGLADASVLPPDFSGLFAE